MTWVVFPCALFLGMAMITLKLWELASLALPLIILLSSQVILIAVFTYFIEFFDVLRAGLRCSQSLLQVPADSVWVPRQMPWQICRLSVTAMFHPSKHTF